MVLNNIASAYVFEDDAIFHDNFDVIFPVVRVVNVFGCTITMTQR